MLRADRLSPGRLRAAAEALLPDSPPPDSLALLRERCAVAISTSKPRRWWPN